jgi:hypothetical protein
MDVVDVVEDEDEDDIVINGLMIDEVRGGSIRNEH